MIDPEHPKLSVARQCELINLPRASYYRAINIGSSIGTETPYNLELMVNRKRVQRLMQLMGLVSVAPKPNTSKKNEAHKVYPYLLRNMIINCPNQVWCTDITYIRNSQEALFIWLPYNAGIAVKCCHEKYQALWMTIFVLVRWSEQLGYMA